MDKQKDSKPSENHTSGSRLAEDKLAEEVFANFKQINLRSKPKTHQHDR